MDNKCLICNSIEVEGDEETMTGHNVCGKGYNKKFENGGIDCKGFKEVQRKCSYCNKTVPVSQLAHGLCSETCRNAQVEYAKAELEKCNKELIEVNKQLENKPPLRSDDTMNLFMRQGYLEEYIAGFNHFFKHCLVN